ncbi:MAG: hypothetical protein FD144_4773 [Rhodospirillaceae bacterium]|nr:MAG: hypothetical protein FD144_4773 [Rhodospirillaceae bacterium]
MNPSLLNDVKITRVAIAAVAAQTDIDGDILDMAGYEGVVFIAKLGDVTDTSALELLAQQNDANSTSGMASLAGSAAFTAGASSADDMLLVLDVYRPRERYVRPKLKRGTANAVVSGIVAIQYGARKLPQSQGSTVVASATLVEPAEA